MKLEESELIHFEHQQKDNVHILTIDKTSPEMKGILKAVATNRGGEASVEAKLEVRGKAPVFIEQPLKCTILEGNFMDNVCVIFVLTLKYVLNLLLQKISTKVSFPSEFLFLDSLIC